MQVYTCNKQPIPTFKKRENFQRTYRLLGYEWKFGMQEEATGNTMINNTPETATSLALQKQVQEVSLSLTIIFNKDYAGIQKKLADKDCHWLQLML